METFGTFKKINKNSVINKKTQNYKTLLKDGNFEIRFYPPTVMASVKMRGTYDSMKKNGYNMLSGYIYGGNSENKKMDMTTPMHIKPGKENGGMSFSIPSDFDSDHLPEPDNEKVFFHKTRPDFLAVLRFAGFANDRRIATKKQQLKRMLEDMGIKNTGRFEYLSYSSPYRMMNRRNEVAFYLNKADAEKILDAA